MRREAGLTLLEVMVALVVVGILAAVVLPSFTRQFRKARASAEVQPLFSDLRVRMEQYIQERGSYPPTLGEDTLHPPGLPGVTRRSLHPMPWEWQSLKVHVSGPDEVFCSYTWVSGDAQGAVGPVGIVFGYVVSEMNWYYLLAKCDMDGDSVFSYYFSSSVDPAIERIAEGE